MRKHVHWALPGEEPEEPEDQDTFKIVIDDDTFKIPVDHDTYLEEPRPPPVPMRSPARPSEIVRLDLDDDDDEFEEKFEAKVIEPIVVEKALPQPPLYPEPQPRPIKRRWSKRRSLSWQGWRFRPFINKNRFEAEEQRTQRTAWEILNEQHNNNTTHNTPMSPSSTASDSSEASDASEESYVDEILVQARKRWSSFEPDCPHCRRGLH